MKKIFNSILLLLISCLSIVSCSNNNKTNGKIIISEVVEGTGNNRAIELYNLTDSDINLADYSLEIHLMNNIKKVSLSNIIKANETFVISYTDSSEEILNKSNLISSDLMFNGTQAIVLKYKNKEIDIVGIKDYQVGYYQDITLTRKKEFLIGRKEFDEYDWIRYNCDNFKYLNTIEVSITNDELFEGPKLTEEFLNAPFYIIDESGKQLGGGGLMYVTVLSYVDGDTTSFKYNKEILDELGLSQGVKLRYQNIDTPESYQGNVQEFGLMAKAYTKSRLSEAFIIQVQSVLNSNITETFGRMLGWVWIDGELLNHSIVKKGYSNLNFSSNDQMLYKDVSYTNFLYDAQVYATKYKLGIHGEKDPFWDYDNNCVKDDVSGINPFK